MSTLNKFRKYGFMAIICAAAVLTACDDDDDDNPTPATNPPVENEEEVITDVTLVFTDTSNTNNVVMASANDPDGEGVDSLQVLDTIRLNSNTVYKLTYIIENGLDPNDVEDIAAEIKAEDDEHQIFYGFTSGLFADPTGDGNIGNGAAGNVNYLDEDSDNQDGSGLPVGLETRWNTTTSIIPRSGDFRVRLMHQPDLKGPNSKWDTGEDDFDITFRIEIN